eukprot:9487576-Pyramimonas_sp.AAC.1
MSFKAAEAHIMLRFVVYELEQLGGSPVFGGPLMGACSSLLAFCEKIHAHPIVIPPNVLARMKEDCDLHIRCCKEAGISLTPKHHLFLHLCDRTDGN